MVNIRLGEKMISIEQAKDICKIKQQKVVAKELNLDGWEKYLDEDQFLDEKLEIFRFLDLDKTTGKSVLDIGAGIGHFGNLCLHQGHTYTGTYFGKTGEKLKHFYKVSNLNAVECGLIANYEKTLPDGPWDCIVMIRTTFELSEEWTTEDWLELKELCLSKLNPGGKLFIKSNLKIDQTRKYGRLETQCQERMREAFKELQPLPYWSYFSFLLIKE